MNCSDRPGIPVAFGSAAVMLMLRTGGQFADSQIRKYLIRALLCFGIAVGAAFATRYIQLSFVGLIATVFAVAVFKESFRRWSNWFVGKRGEMAISDALKSLPDDYVLLNDLMLPNGKGNVDHLIIGLNGLFVSKPRTIRALSNASATIGLLMARRFIA